MSSIYLHKQTNNMLRWAMVPGPIGIILAGYFSGNLAFLLPLAVILGTISLCFCSLTVEVTETDLNWYFGPGVWRNSTARRDIVGATPEINKWWWGWGIHRTPRGWLYNVGGLEAVEVTLRNGQRFRIGSDEPRLLADALSRRSNS